MEQIKYLFHLYKAYFLIIGAVLLVVIFLLWNSFMTLSPQSSPSSSGQNASFQRFVAPVTTKEVKNLHWVNNSILTYTFFHPTEKRLVLAQLANNKEQILLNRADLKLSELYWSSKNDLLIFDYGVPYKTYLLPRQGQLRQLPIQGYGFSWSPNGNEIFYINTLAAETPQIYNLASNTKQDVSKTILPFQFSYWPHSGNSMVLYFVDIETGTGRLSETSLSGNTTPTELSPNARFPTLSPNGSYISYSYESSIYISPLSSNDTKTLYKSSSEKGSLSFGWLNDNQLLIIDTNNTSPVLKIISITGEEKTFPHSLGLQPDQYINIAVSPDGKTLALASEKDGLFILNLTK